MPGEHFIPARPLVHSLASPLACSLGLTTRARMTIAGTARPSGPNGGVTDSGDHEAGARARVTVAGAARPLAVGDETAVPGDQESRDPARVDAAARWP